MAIRESLEAQETRTKTKHILKRKGLEVSEDVLYPIGKHPDFSANVYISEDQWLDA